MRNKSAAIHADTSPKHIAQKANTGMAKLKSRGSAAPDVISFEVPIKMNTQNLSPQR